MEQMPLHPLSAKGKGIVWLSMVGVLTLCSAPLSLLNLAPNFRGYYLFEWLVFPTNMIGYLIALGIVTTCIVLPRPLPWWRMAVSGAGAGASAGVLAGILYFIALDKGLSSLNVLFLALAGAFPGVVIATIHSSWLAGRGLGLLHYIGAALLAGSIITAMAALLFFINGVWKLSSEVLNIITRQLWLVPTVFSVIALVALFVADSIGSYLAQGPGHTRA